MTSTPPPKSLSEALVALQAQLPRIPKTDEAQVGTRTYRYANLATITDLLMFTPTSTTYQHRTHQETHP